MPKTGETDKTYTNTDLNSLWDREKNNTQNMTSKNNDSA